MRLKSNCDSLVHKITRLLCIKGVFFGADFAFFAYKKDNKIDNVLALNIFLWCGRALLLLHSEAT